MSTGQRSGVQVVHRAAAILMALRDEREGLSLAQIADRVGLPRSTVHRLVSALEQERFVVAAPSSRGYLLGPALAGFATAAAGGLISEVRGFLVQLSHDVKETVDLAVLEHDRVLFIAQVVGSAQRLHAVSSVGATFPTYCTANGKALLAQLSDHEIEWLLPAKLERLTPNTITTRKELLHELRRVREQGYATDREEHTTGICAVGTTIAGNGERPHAAMTVVLPASRYYGAEAELASALLGARSLIDERLSRP